MALVTYMYMHVILFNPGLPTLEIDDIQNINGLLLVRTVEYCIQVFPLSITGHLEEAEAPQWAICYSREWMLLNWQCQMDGFADVLDCKRSVITCLGS